MFHGSITPAEFGSAWPTDVPVQIHARDADPMFIEEVGDINAAHEIVKAAAQGELILYPCDQHLFTDFSLPSDDAKATAQLSIGLLFLGQY
jgi:dienelactone hydrolase